MLSETTYLVTICVLSETTYLVTICVLSETSYLVTICVLSETTYLVTITTGKQERAETEAEIFCTLIGQWGDTGEKILSDCKSHREPFQRGQVGT